MKSADLPGVYVVAQLHVPYTDIASSLTHCSKGVRVVLRHKVVKLNIPALTLRTAIPACR